MSYFISLACKWELSAVKLIWCSPSIVLKWTNPVNSSVTGGLIDHERQPWRHAGVRMFLSQCFSSPSSRVQRNWRQVIKSKKGVWGKGKMSFGCWLSSTAWLAWGWNKRRQNSLLIVDTPRPLSKQENSSLWFPHCARIRGISRCGSHAHIPNKQIFYCIFTWESQFQTE